MISIFINHSRDEIRNILNKKNIKYVNVEDPGFSTIESLAKQQDMFNEQNNYLVFEYPKNKEDSLILKNDFLIKSPHHFYFESLCSKNYLPKSLIDFIVEKEVKQNLKNKKAGEVFELSDAVFSGNVQKAWLVFNKLNLKKEIGAIEEMHGTFLWAIKTIVMSMDRDARKTLSPFVLNKIYKFKSSQIELLDYYKKVLMLGVLAHLGEADFAKSFEKLILQLPR